MALDIDVTELWCRASGLPPADERSNHSLIFRGPIGRQMLVCRWCGQAPADIAAGVVA